MPSFHDYKVRASTITALDEVDIVTPTPIQEASIPVLLEGRDVIAQAYTGSGKTLAFGIPLIERMDGNVKNIQALVLCPTRELAQQVAEVLAQLTRKTNIKLTVVFGGRAIGPQQDTLKRGPQIVVGTPGRVLDLIERGSMRLDAVTFMVLDEADEMLDRGFGPDVQRILARTPKTRQTALFSATTPDWVHQVSAKYLKSPEVISTRTEEDIEPDIDHVVYEVWTDKFAMLLKLLDEPVEGTTLVFGRTKHGVRNLSGKLSRLGYNVGELQGNLGQNERDRVLKRFREGKTPILVATNVAARGLDVLHIERVINYELPETHELFTHRIGRTGRMGRSGRAITLLGAADIPKWREIEKGLGKRLPRMTPDGKVVELPGEKKVSSTSSRRNSRSYSWSRRR